MPYLDLLGTDVRRLHVLRIILMMVIVTLLLWETRFRCLVLVELPIGGRHSLPILMAGYLPDWDKGLGTPPACMIGVQ